MTSPYWQDDTCSLYLGDCREVLAGMPDASVDAIVTDPPYELAFLGRKWDASGIAYDTAMWAQCLRVLKPGGHLLAFGAPRTYHRMTVAIEDAGFEIRDSIHWVFSQGFPKGTDIGKAIDRRRDDREAVLQVTVWLAAARDAAGFTNQQVDAAFGFDGMARHWTSQGMTAAVPPWEHWERLRELLGFGAEMDDRVRELNARKGKLGENWDAREVIGRRHSGLEQGGSSVFLSGTTRRHEDGMVPVTAPASDEARRWHGWNTALKPAHEPIVVARKSTGFDTATVNVLKHGTGALNIGGCRVAPTGESRVRVGEASQESHYASTGATNFAALPGIRGGDPAGRWPTNVVFTHSASCAEDGACAEDCPVAELDRQSGVLASGANPTRRGSDKFRDVYGEFAGQRECTPARGADSGGASRFFPVFRYEAKASASERPKLADGTAHNTVKPLSLLRWMVRLVTPPGGLICDPFAGSGTTGEACVIEGFRSLLIEQDPAHAELIKARLTKPIQPTLGEAS